MTKIEQIRALIKQHRSQELYELLRGTSPYNAKRPSDYKSPQFSTEILRLFVAARDHLYVLSKGGRDEGKIVDGRVFYFARPDQFEMWLAEDAPGMLESDVAALYKSLENKDSE